MIVADRRADLVAMGIAVAVAAAVYAGSLANGFVYDDVRIILERADLKDLGNWREIITNPWWPRALYRPLTQLSLAVDWALGGGDPGVFHAVNVALHAAATAAVYLLARCAMGAVGAGVAALLFAVHPVHVEAVANVVGRAEIMAALFVVVAALCYRRDGVLAAAGVGGWRRAVSSFGTLASLVLALAAKESALALPGVLLIVDWLESRRTGDRFDRRFTRHAVLWFAAVALTLEWLWFRSALLGGLVGDDPAPGLVGEGLAGRTLVMLPVVVEYLRLLVFPLHLSADYSPNYLEAVPALTAKGLAGLFVLVLATVAGWKLRHRLSVVTFGLAWTGGALLVVSNLLVPTGVLLAERSMYLPSVGIVLVAGAACEAAWTRWRIPAVAVVAVAALLGSVRTVTRVPVWRSQETFYPSLVADAPGSFRGMWVTGMLEWGRGNAELGEQLLRGALVIYPLFPNTWQDLGRQLEADGRWEDAATAMAVAFRLDETRLYDAAGAVTNYARAGLLDSAMAVASRARAVDPHEPEVLSALGDVAHARGRPLEALTWHRQAAWVVPDEPRFWLRAAVAALAAEYCPEVARSLARARELEPDAPALTALGEGARAAGCDTLSRGRPPATP